MSDPIRPELSNHLSQLAALLTPNTPTTAFPICDVSGDSVLMHYADQMAVPANHAGVPDLSIPAGCDNHGLPISDLLLGPDLSEALLLRIGRAFKIATAGEDGAKRNLKG